MKIIIKCSTTLYSTIYCIKNEEGMRAGDELTASVNCQNCPSVENYKLFVSSLTLDCPRFPDFIETIHWRPKNEK